MWQLLADAVLCTHVALMLFVVLGLPLVIVGNLRRWRWVNSPWLRFAHLATILVVAGEAWAGVVCPLTTLEMWLRAQAHATTYEGSFVEHWLQALLFWQAPAWVFTAVYSLFGLAVAATWWRWPVRFGRPRANAGRPAGPGVGRACRGPDPAGSPAPCRRLQPQPIRDSVATRK